MRPQHLLAATACILIALIPGPAGFDAAQPVENVCGDSYPVTELISVKINTAEDGIKSDFIQRFDSVQSYNECIGRAWDQFLNEKAGDMHLWRIYNHLNWDDFEFTSFQKFYAHNRQARLPLFFTRVKQGGKQKDADFRKDLILIFAAYPELKDFEISVTVNGTGGPGGFSASPRKVQLKNGELYFPVTRNESDLDPLIIFKLKSANKVAEEKHKNKESIEAQRLKSALMKIYMRHPESDKYGGLNEITFVGFDKPVIWEGKNKGYSRMGVMTLIPALKVLARELESWALLKGYFVQPGDISISFVYDSGNDLVTHPNFVRPLSLDAQAMSSAVVGGEGGDGDLLD